MVKHYPDSPNSPKHDKDLKRLEYPASKETIRKSALQAYYKARAIKPKHFGVFPV
jgi:hypothetical protein